ncbi:hypothetical protein [Chroococcus sp. FPU101]|uniref:DUF6888 family protein n=1 Tax=Chroococcus sp. FPU101 TaxID=1974212 RepID=UPI001A8CB916|nr:hypothetical protein [Chroococcus sp. FPU101]GFE71714.1 hypothetical protein CFPU101_43240 [Chroococcus sp. FPU101]
MPTEKQKDTAIFICQLLSNLYQPIHLFRYDNRLKIIYILAGINETLEILINEDGNWDFES